MNRFAIEIIPAFVSLTVICFLFQAFNVFGGLLQYPLGDAANLNTISGWFNISLLSGLVGGGAILIGVAGLLFKQNTYAIYALLLFGFGVLFNGISQFILAVPNTIGALFNMIEAINPTPDATNPIAFVIVFLVGYAMFWFLISIVLQRDV